MKSITTLSTENVDAIIGAIEIAQDESGGDYSEEIQKLMEMYPKVVKLRNQRKLDWDAESEKQRKQREIIAGIVFKKLDLERPILPQLVAFISIGSNYDLVRKHYSDDICLSGDLFDYHFDDLKKFGLLTELRESIRTEAEKPENHWMRDMSTTTEDKELWHRLARILGRAC